MNALRSPEVVLAGRRVAAGAPVFVIAEAGVNHDGDLAVAEDLVAAAAEAGADAVKFQTFRTSGLVSADAPLAGYQAERGPGARNQADLLEQLELAPQAFERLRDRARRLGILFLSSPFDAESLALLEQLELPALKLGSGELTNVPLLTRAAATGRPLILSTGMSTLAEVRAAVQCVRRAGCTQLALLHCVSCYPAAPEDANLRAMATLEKAFHVPVGFSDHTTGIEVPVAAVAAGACILEKHLTLDRTRPGPDHAASLNPEEFAALVSAVRRVERILGDGRKVPRPAETGVAAVARRSVAAARDLHSGTVLDRDDLTLLRPATGLPPSRLGELQGRRLLCDVPAGTLLREEWLE